MADTDISSYITRYNLVQNRIEYFNGSDWYSAGSSGGDTTTVQAYTPTITGWDVNTNVSFFYSTNGKVVTVWGAFISGNPQSVNVTVSLPVTAFAGHLPTIATTVGTILNTDANGGFLNFQLFYDGSDTSKIYTCRTDTNSANSPPTKSNADALSVSGTYFSVNFTYPIA